MTVRIFFLVAVIFIAQFQFSLALDNPDKEQRKAKSVMDLQFNTLSNIKFPSSNFGILFLDITRNQGGGYWPRGSVNQYIFGSGFWFGAIKRYSDGNLRKYVELSYNPNTGKSWFVPGRIEDGEEIDLNEIDKYRVYFSTDMVRESGTPIDPGDGPSWPLWIISDDKYYLDSKQFSYVYNVDLRNTENFPFGPSISSSEDIVSSYKDTDLSYFEGGSANRSNQGYPLGLQVTSRIYSWNSEMAKDFIIISYQFQNTSNDTLFDCIFGEVIDCDIARAPNTQLGANNDRARYLSEIDSLEMAVAWTDVDRGEMGRGFGYLGVRFLETPMIDGNNFVVQNTGIVPPDNQVGLGTFINWPIEIDPTEDEERYDFLNSQLKYGDTGPGDKRILMATNPFSMRPGDIANISVLVAFASTANGGEATGEIEDITGFKIPFMNTQLSFSDTTLFSKVVFAKQIYYNQKYLSVEAEQNTNNSKLLIYPNPSESYISVWGIDELSDNTVKFYSSTGFLVSEMKASLIIDISLLPSGIYFVHYKGKVNKLIKY